MNNFHLVAVTLMCLPSLFTVTGLKVSNTDEMNTGVEKIRSGTTPNAWGALHYVDEATVEFTYSDKQKFSETFQDKEVAYYLVCIPITGGGTRIVFVQWIGPDAPPAKKGQRNSDLEEAKQHLGLSAGGSYVTVKNKANFTDQPLEQWSGPNPSVQVIE